MRIAGYYSGEGINQCTTYYVCKNCFALLTTVSFTISPADQSRPRIVKSDTFLPRTPHAMATSAARRATTHASAGPSSVDDWQKKWPGRHEQIKRLLEHLEDPYVISPLLVQGGPSTGKTAIVR